MCSINFIYKYKVSQEDLRKAMMSMVKISKHRGPDATNCVIQKNFAFGFNRLALVGGSLGQQPIFDKKNELILICNGEIFNHLDLKRKYFPNNNFLTKSDVEIIMHLYKKFGEEGISYLEGQFSFVLFDLKKNVVFLGRDRFGINPLFYYVKNNTLIVSSEIKSIIASKLVKNINLDKEGLVDSLLFYGAVPPKTCFNNIYQIPPASYGFYSVNTRELKINSYWRIKQSKIKLNDMGISKKILEDKLYESVQKRLQGVSTTGIYLSGGLDSSIIAMITSGIVGKKMQLFSISFKDKRYDESYYQKQLSDMLDIDLNQVSVSFDDIIKFLRICVFHVETPLIRSAPVPMFLLSNAVRKVGIKYVLCGEGADEIFAGYPVFLKGKASFENKWKVLNPYLSLFKEKKLESYAQKTYKSLSKQTNSNWLTENRKKEIQTKLSQYLLVNQGDRMSMANGVEQRFPFLDTEVVKFAFSLENRLLIGKNNGKVILRETFKDLLPKEIIARKKQGYLAPDDIVVQKLLSTKQYKYLLKKSYFEKVNIFDFDEAKKITQNLKDKKSQNEFDANAILFVLTTHLLYDLFLS